ncbi:D-aminoacyl-tRNA deacylase [Gemmatimonas sp.]|uniref:D-aminoacyl-tRNA deacylase n=1 Tax=Gemmatimonas sp. TaxID=1962908 RepID=UPI00286E6EAE|nr:D-aminoacyl-tRNA deacylase [Gemmatimonas sp.]
MPSFRAMRILLQRVSKAEVRIRPNDLETGSRVSGRIQSGYLLLVGFTHTDTESEIRWMADKIVGLRLFADTDGKLNHDIAESAGALLVVSQFTLYADVRKGKRPSFVDAARPETAFTLYNQFVMLLRHHQIVVQTGEFGATMDVELVNDGPVTIWLEREAAIASV